MRNATLVVLVMAAVLTGLWPTANGSDEATIERLEAARAVFAQQLELLDMGRTEPEQVYLWSTRLLGAQKAVAPAEAVAGHLKRMQALDKHVAEQVAMGALTPVDVQAARYYVAEARVWATR